MPSSSDFHSEPTQLDSGLLTRKYGLEVASKLLSLDSDIRRLYNHAAKTVGQDSTQIARLADPVCRYVAEAERRRRRRRWQRTMLCFASVIVLLSCVIACDSSYRFLCAVGRLLWIRVSHIIYLGVVSAAEGGANVLPNWSHASQPAMPSPPCSGCIFSTSQTNAKMWESFKGCIYAWDMLKWVLNGVWGLVGLQCECPFVCFLFPFSCCCYIHWKTSLLVTSS